MELIITPDSLERIGSGSIIGALVQLYGADRLSEEKTVVLVFVERSAEERAARGGVQEAIVPAYMPRCLVDDILFFAEKGYSVKTKTISETEAQSQDPKKFL